MNYFITTEKWINYYPNPIELKPNELVEIKEKVNDNPNWKGWIFCESQKKTSGWVPEHIISIIENNQGVIKEEYSAKEMNMNKGEKVIGLKELNGWFWVKRKSDNNEGWLPLEILKEISENEHNE